MRPDADLKIWPESREISPRTSPCYLALRSLAIAAILFRALGATILVFVLVLVFSLLLPALLWFSFLLLTA
jgi:hypothetical protein